MTWLHSSRAVLGASGGQTIQFGDSPSVDAFGKARFSEPFTLFDSKQVWNDPDIADSAENFPLFFDNQEISGGSTTTLFNVNRASTTLGVALNTAGVRARQTKQRFNYQPGKSQQFIITGVIGNSGSGITKRLGYFDENNGLFFQLDDGVLSVVIRSNVSGSVIDTVIPQSNWNVDKLDGTGLSGVLLDLSKAQILCADFEWLGVGRVRFGVFIDGLAVYCHEVLNSNISTSVYMATPNLPIRIEIENDGSGAASTVEHICSTVISEGGIQPNGVLRFEETGATAFSTPTSGTTYALCGIRLKSAYLSADIRETLISIIEDSGANNPFTWKLHFNPTITAALTYANVANSATQFGFPNGTPANNVLTDEGTVIAGGHQARQDANVTITLDSALRLGSLIDGTSDELVVSTKPLTNNQTFHGGQQWLESW